MVFTLEVSNGVYELNKQHKKVIQKDFEAIGRDLLRAVWEYSRVEITIGEKLSLIETKKSLKSMGLSVMSR